MGNAVLNFPTFFQETRTTTAFNHTDCVALESECGMQPGHTADCLASPTGEGYVPGSNCFVNGSVNNVSGQWSERCECFSRNNYFVAGK